MAICTITPKELGDLLQQQPGLPLIDVRTPAEFREAHVIGAHNFPLDQLSADQLKSAQAEADNGMLHFICKGGTRSRMACEKALALGFVEIGDIEGGTDQCINAGLPVERGRKTISLERQVRIVAGSLILLGAVLAITHNPYWAGLSGFVGAGLIFAGVTDTCGMGMMLAKMPWNK
jgi:rhodanese-related sulfurtransferase